jgi:hypothetical protein
MKVRITILSEDSIGRAMGSGKHGFSAFVETDRGKFQVLPAWGG